MKPIRLLGLALVTCVALMGFTGVASASHVLENGVSPATLHGTQVETPESPTISVGSIPVNCYGISFEAPVEGIIATAFSSSSVGNGTCSGPSEFKMNNCRFEFQPGSADRFNFGPRSCSGATLAVSGCLITIPPQAGLAATYSSTEGLSLTGHTIEINLTNVQYTVSGCKLLPPSGNDLHFHVKWNVTESVSQKGGESVQMQFKSWEGEEPLQEPWACCGNPVGLFMTGKTFSAQGFPVNVAGAQVASNKLKFEAVNTGSVVECAEGSFSTGQWSKAVGEVGLAPTYSSCTGLGNSATVTPNGCSWALNEAEQFESTVWHGGGELQCPAGKSIEISIPVLACKLYVPGQHLSGTQVLKNEGTGTAAAINAALTATGMSYTREGKGILCKAAFPNEKGSDLKLSQGIRLTGTGP